MKEQGGIHPGGEGLLENSYLQDLACKNCNVLLGLRCEATTSAVLQKNQLILKLPNMSIVAEGGGQASLVVKRTMPIAQSPSTKSTQRDAGARSPDTRTMAAPSAPSQSQPPPSQAPHAQMQAPGQFSPAQQQQLQSQFVNGHTQPAMAHPDPVRELQQFAAWASTTLENTDRAILRMGNAINNIEKDMRNFNVMLGEMRNELLARPSARDIAAIRSELQVLRESAPGVPNGVKGPKLAVDEFEVLTENMSRISEKANAVDDLKMQVDFLKSRTKRLEEVARGGTISFSAPHPTSNSDPGRSPRNHVAPFVPSMNNGLQNGLPSLPNQGAGGNHATGLPRKREAENVNILPSIPSAYPNDETEHPHKRYKYTSSPGLAEQSMPPKEYRSLAAQPNLGPHEARTFVITDNGDFKHPHPGFVADPLTPKSKSMTFRGGGRGRGRGSGSTGRVTQYSPPPQDSIERPPPYQGYEGMNVGTTGGGDWLGSNAAVSAARTSEPYLEQKASRRNSEGVVLTKNGRPDGRSIKRRPIQRNSEGIPVTRSGKPDGRFLAARTRKNDDQSQSPAPSNGMDENSEDSHRVDSVVSPEATTPTAAAEQLVVVEKELPNGDGDVDAREELVPVTPLLTTAPVPVAISKRAEGGAG